MRVKRKKGLRARKVCMAETLKVNNDAAESSPVLAGFFYRRIGGTLFRVRVYTGSGYANTEHFTDDGFSGGDFDRPGWKQMLSRIENGDIGTVIVKDMSRVGRDYLQVGFYTEVFFRERGVRFIAVSNGVDSTNNTSSEFAPFLNIMNEWYLRDCSRKITAVLRAKGKEGKPLTNNPPYGYMKDAEDRNRWIIDEEAVLR